MGRRSRSACVLGILSLLIAPACGDDSTGGGNTTPVADRLVGCGEHKYPRQALDGPTGAENGPHAASRVLREQIKLSSGAELTPTKEWRILHQSPARVIFGGGFSKRRGTLKAEVVVDWDDGEWTLGSIDFGCGIHVDTGDDMLVDFALAPGAAPEPTSRSLDLLIKDRNCGGDDVMERLRDPLVEYDARSVGLLLTAVSNPGQHPCVGHSASEYRLELSEPLGNRVLMDLSSYPPLPPGPAPSRTQS